MSSEKPSLPPEILDLILDHLCDVKATLESCCLVSKSWVPRARRHLFFHVEFSTYRPIEWWIKAFPVPSKSPAHYARVLTLNGFVVIDHAGKSARGWVRTFSHITHLRMVEVLDCWDGRPISLFPFPGLFPALESLSLIRSFIPPSRLLNLICSFPLLKDLQLKVFTNRNPTIPDKWNLPSTSPELTGTLHLTDGIGSVISRLLDLPNCCRFTKVVMMCHVDDSDLTRELVLRCSDNLEYLSIAHCSSAVYRAPSPLDLSKASNLKELQFRLHSSTLNLRWIITALQTVKFHNLRNLTIFSATRSNERTAGTEELRDLDRLLARLWISHSIRPKIRFLNREIKDELEDVGPSLLPELASLGGLAFGCVPIDESYSKVFPHVRYPAFQYP